MTLQDTSAFQRSCLQAIGILDDPNGLEIIEELERHNYMEVHHGRLYPNLDEMVEMGLIRKQKVDGRSHKYTLTPRARREIKAHVKRWEDAFDKSQYYKVEETLSD